MVYIAGSSQALEEIIDVAASKCLSRDTTSSHQAPAVAFVGFAVWRREDNGDANLSDEQVFVIRDGCVSPLPHRNDLANSSPDGLSWGYLGSAPDQLAVAMLMEVLGDWERVRPISLEFRNTFIARLPRQRNWSADGSDILAIALEIEREQTRHAHKPE